ncbi:MAG: hypothetical protein GY784_06215 [Gammaproteobacteria bacterium]|nr:hypothetical protein [Gammaproteobacteria bacterium]
MKPDWLALQETIRSTIPLSEAMQFEITDLDVDTICVYAPLAPNVNIHGTGFAGSIYSMAVLTGWALCRHIMSVYGLDGDLVVGKAEIKYRSAVTGDIYCHCSASKTARQHFVDVFKSSAKSRLALRVSVGDFESAILSADYFLKAKLQG